jgi:hypothetical protein
MAVTDQGAKDIIAGFLGQYGLASLGEWAWNLWLESGGDFEQIKLALPSTPEFKQRFPAYEAMAQKGRAITPDQYIAYENDLFASLQQYGVPKGMYDTPDAVAKLLVEDVSINEARQRLAIAADAAYKAPEEVRSALNERYNVGIGGLIGYYLDPDKAAPALEQQYASAQVIGAAARQGIDLETQLGERLASQGVDYRAASQGFSQVVGMEDLSRQEQGGEAIRQEDLVSGVFGDADQQTRIQREAGRRSARYKASEGGAAANQTGVSGLRTATT